MAITKPTRNMLSTGVSDSSDSTFLTADSSENATFAGNLIVTGNLTVSGTQTVVSSTVETHADPLIELNTGAGSNSNDLGFVFERGSTGDNAALIWDESADVFTVGTTTATGTSTGNMSITAAGFTAAAITGTTGTFSGEVSAGTLDIGGTNITSTAAEINLLDALDRGSILYGNASGATAVLGQGSADQVLTSDGTDISWEDAGGGAVSAVANGSNDRVATFSGSDSLNGEANLTFTAGVLYMNAASPTAPSGSSERSYIYHNNASNTSLHIGAQYGNAASVIHLETQNTPRVSILGDGKVGIGDTSPDELLHITAASGDCNIRMEGDAVRLKKSGSDWLSYDGSNLKLSTGNSERMRINSSGSVGIGTTSPGRTFHVYKAGDGQTPVRFSTGNSNSNLEFYNDSTGWELRSDEDMRFATRRSGQGSDGFTFYRTSSTEVFKIGGDGTIILRGGSTDCNLFFKMGTSEKWHLQSDGSGSPGSDAFWIGDSGNDNGVYVSQNGSSWSGISDERLKRNWTNLTGATDKIDTLTKVGTFNRRGKTTGDWSSDLEVGLSAQEVEAILPQAVHTGGDIEFGEGDSVTGVKGLSYERLVPLLVKSIQELNARIKVLEESSEITALEQRTKTLEEITAKDSDITALEQRIYDIEQRLI